MKTEVTGLGDIGLITDRNAYDVPPNAWDAMTNVRCKNGHIEPMDGYDDVTAEAHTGSTNVVRYHEVARVQKGDVTYFVMPYDSNDDGAANKIVSARESVVNDISRVGGYNGAGPWSACSFNGLVVLNNGSNAPQYTDGVATCANMQHGGSSSWGTDYDARRIVPYREYLMALDITDGSTEYSQMVHWSAPAAPGAMPTTWDHTSASSGSRRIVLAETPGRVVDGLPLGETMVIYKEDAVHVLRWVGGTFVFKADIMTSSRGIYAAGCVVDIGGKHIVLGDGMLYEHQLGETVDILKGRAAESLFSQIDEDNYHRTFLAHNKHESEVWICYPGIGSTWPDQCLVYNYRESTFYPRTLPPCSGMDLGVVTAASGGPTIAELSGTIADLEGVISSAAYSPIGDTLVAASDQLVKFGEGFVEGIVTKTGLHLGAPDEWAMLRRIMPYAQGEPYEVSVGGQDDISGGASFVTTGTLTPGEDHKLDTRSVSRQFTVQFVLSGNTRLSGYTLEGVGVGTR
jgi:hypothetical protein